MNLRQLTRADVAIGVAVLLFIGALIRPQLQARAYGALVELAVTEVDALRSAALDNRTRSGEWPESAPPGEVPSAVAPAFAEREGFALGHLTLEWTRLSVIEYVEAPPTPAFSFPDEDEEPDDSPAPGGQPGDLPPDSVGPRRVPSARDVGAIIVHTGNESLLADLLVRYGTAVSYVRDTTWTLVVDDRTGSTP